MVWCCLWVKSLSTTSLMFVGVTVSHVKCVNRSDSLAFIVFKRSLSWKWHYVIIPLSLSVCAPLTHLLTPSTASSSDWSAEPGSLFDSSNPVAVWGEGVMSSAAESPITWDQPHSPSLTLSPCISHRSSTLPENTSADRASVCVCMCACVSVCV